MAHNVDAASVEDKTTSMVSTEGFKKQEMKHEAIQGDYRQLEGFDTTKKEGLGTFKNIDMDMIIKVLTDGNGELKCHLRMDFPTLFSQVDLSSTAKKWLQFISSRIFPTVDMSNIDTFQATLLHVIL
ncbi:hypothetical protein Golax_022807 [Gossypium laxum]|uniref:Uncharacterized protein n=1 Tax=Gossypium laxum TaxID=34288 RepID=A0A7J9B3G0_9ROSI|nr:hypothetical protein [Gossypium laxum]